MDVLRAASWVILVLSWLACVGLLAWNHYRVRAERRRQGIPEEKPAIRDPRSMHGLLLEGIAFLILFTFRRSAVETAPWQYLASVLLAILSVVILAAALRHLDMEWRIKAVVTDDHQLVMTGPYRIVRHPIFAALVAQLLASSLVLTQTWAAWLAIAVCLIGTEIRINAEDGLLHRRFGKLYADYRMRTPAYLPFLR
ncbi:MAG: isoprenylcysteine carboxylmethyltransferase family protein [Bryobacterales bacterium]|nr:isoprenylcysteine carboxylmethyltransferase family protein [Bryobacterales bacterium]